MKAKAKQGERGFDAAKWLAQKRQIGFSFHLFGIAGQPDTMKVHMIYPKLQTEWVTTFVFPELVTHKPAIIAQLMEEGRARQVACKTVITAATPIRLCA